MNNLPLRASTVRLQQDWVRLIVRLYLFLHVNSTFLLSTFNLMSQESCESMVCPVYWSTTCEAYGYRTRLWSIECFVMRVVCGQLCVGLCCIVSVRSLCGRLPTTFGDSSSGVLNVNFTFTAIVEPSCQVPWQNHPTDHWQYCSCFLVTPHSWCRNNVAAGVMAGATLKTCKR